MSNAHLKSSIQVDRTTWQYRFLESLLGIASLTFLLSVVILAIFYPALAAVILIVYSFLWVMKFSLNAIYTIYTYKQVLRWELFDWSTWSHYMQKGLRNEARSMLQQFGDEYRRKIDWKAKIDTDLQVWDMLEDTQFANPLDMYHVAILSIYNESSSVILPSLRSIRDSGYPLERLIVIISQEDRIGHDHITQVKKDVAAQEWLEFYELQEEDLNVVYDTPHEGIKYTSQYLEHITFSSSKLNVFFTRHPDGLVGEIKGKASNEDWGARQASLLLSAKGVQSEMVLVTSLDADSQVGSWFFHHLSYRYCVTADRDRCGFQPVHVYSKNFFRTGMWQRQVATQNTLANMMYLSIEEETHFFAIYSVPLTVLRQVDFWVRELIAEDYTLYAKCVTHFLGNFRVVPFYGVFEGDAVEADDYIEAINNQYKQLQRWTWGGVESFPYIFKKLFIEPHGRQMDLRKRLKIVSMTFSEHFFWASTPLVLSVGIVLPQYVQGEVFRQQAIAQNLSIFSQYFVWLSFIFVGIFSYITFRYIAGKAVKNEQRTLYQNFLIMLQWLAMPLVFGLLSIPALDSQIRGIRGKYLGYWVTPKK